MTTVNTPTPAILTLSSKTILTDIPTGIAYILRQYTRLPKRLSDTYFSQTISLIDVVSRYGSDANQVCNQVISDLTTVFNRIYSGGQTTVEATASTADGFNYSLTINITIIYGGQTCTVLNTITVDNNGQILLTGAESG